MKKILLLVSVFALMLATWTIERAGAASRCVPNKRFVVLSGGLVSDTLTNLVWQQQASSTAISWATAQTYCPSGFRLPTVRELTSLLDLTVDGRTIDQTAFSNAPAESFWTRSPYARLSGWAWVVEFRYGATTAVDAAYTSCWARCVR